MDESDSMNQVTQKYLEDALDSEKDVTDQKVRKEITEKIIKEHPDWKKASIDSSLSKSKGRIAKIRGLNPKDLGVGKPKPKYDDSLNLTVDESQKAENTGLDVKNPKATGKDGKPIQIKHTESPLSESTFGSIGSLAYDMFALSDNDMEQLTEGERKDIGDTLKPIADQYFYGEKATVAFAFGALMALFIKKKRQAKVVRHTRELKEGKEINKEKSKPKLNTELENFNENPVRDEV